MPKVKWRAKAKACVLCEEPSDVLAHPHLNARKPFPKDAKGICLPCALKATVDLLRDSGKMPPEWPLGKAKP